MDEVQVGSTVCEPFVVVIPATTVLADLWARVNRDIATLSADGVEIEVIHHRTTNGAQGVVTIDAPLWSLTAGFVLEERNWVVPQSELTVTVTQKPFLMSCVLIEGQVRHYLAGNSIELPEKPATEVIVKKKTYSAYQDHKSLLPTGADILGPFYTPGAPMLGEGKNLAPYPTLILSGTVADTDGTPLAGVVLDIWQADPTGVYDEHGMHLRGKITTGKDGGYSVGTVKPGFYRINEPGQPDEFRCSHIHVKLWVGGVEKLTTQLYFAGDKFDDTDHWFDPRRCVTFPNKDDARCEFHFVLAKQ